MSFRDSTAPVRAGASAPEALLIGGRSGVGKSTVMWEVSVLLQAARVAHCVVEGDLLDQAHPAPPGDPQRTLLTERNLAALWGNYAGLGYRRLVYTNTVSVLEADLVTRAMGGDARVTGVLLTADDTTANARLAVREIGSQLAPHMARSATMAQHLDATAPDWVTRIPTAGRTVPGIARDVVAAAGWG
ncbi:hypothetical protein [Marinactinospora rubrisoli]|uniref:ATPase n=1 Tax=Marinactinospora rubrisoli TaxID=2715399 RepID=A0ABW2KBP8_9ACTN